ncbi:PH domain-containing protein [Blastococcus sp. SYSU D00813]
MAAPVRLRMSRTALVPVLVLFVCVLPLAASAAWTAVFLLLPLSAAAWVLRVGVDIDDDGLTARSVVGARRVPWGELAGIRVGDRASLWLVTTRGTQVRLPVLRARDLPRLAALSGGRIDVPAPPRR